MNIHRTRQQYRQARDNGSEFANPGGFFDEENVSNISISNWDPTSGVEVHLACNNHFQELLVTIAEKDEQIRTHTSRVAELEGAAHSVLSFCPHLNGSVEDLPLFAARFVFAVIYSLTLTFLHFPPHSQPSDPFGRQNCFAISIQPILCEDPQGPRYMFTLF